jgi:glycerate 2-kinase
MMELPIDPDITLEDTVAFYTALVHSGASITEINCVRKHFSAVKGGRLAMAAMGVESVSLLVSDVPRRHLDALASGPTLPDTSTVEQCREVLERYKILERCPESVRRFFGSAALVETPKPGSIAGRSWTLLDADDLAEAARRQAEALGFHCVVDNTCDDWEYRAAAAYLLERLRQLRLEHRRVCVISAGEVSVQVPGDATAFGIGGRNQQFALHAATLLEPSDGPVAVLSAGSDGIDGNSEATGAVVDEETLREVGTEAALRALERFDCFTFLERVGATIVTGATGNNLRDLRVLLGE